MKIQNLAGKWFQVSFKYEHVPTFCFICGLLGHADKLYTKIFETLANELSKPYGPWMKAMPRRQQYLTGSKWLRSGSSMQQPEKDHDMSMTNATMGESGSGKTGIEKSRSQLQGICY